MQEGANVVTNARQNDQPSDYVERMLILCDQATQRALRRGDSENVNTLKLMQSELHQLANYFRTPCDMPDLSEDALPALLRHQAT